LRNGMSLANITGHIQTGVIGVLLILSVLLPNVANKVQEIMTRRRLRSAQEVVLEMEAR